jgi:hypothetical protein
MQQKPSLSVITPKPDFGADAVRLAAVASDVWFERLESIKSLQSGWDSYSAPAPGAVAFANALAFLQVLKLADKVPSKLAPSVVGGIGITFKNAARKVYVEFNNKGGVLALFSDGVSDPRVEKISPDEKAYLELIGKIKTYLDE